MTFKSIQVALALFSLIPFSLSAQSEEERGLSIAKEQVARNQGWVDSVSAVEMTLDNGNGETYSREIAILSYEGDEVGDKSLITFNKPLDVKGVSLLTYSKINDPDDQWIYLPSVKRVKRISSKNKSGPFMGSEFSYEDMASFEHQEYFYRYLGEKNINNKDVYLVEQKPKDKNSGYSKRIAWVDKTEYIVLKMEFYDRKGVLLKTLTYDNYQEHLSKIWRAHTMVMENHQNGKITTLNTQNLTFNNGLEEGDFSQSSLKRTR
ncbi:outer membrane lipoprotein-sorting protein [Grimontia marina]|uniref:Uncharacterized protein TP-0789 domain-containing protein n=1 Tax=Grimontia marina TaxID=646534 RepID=A0A128FAG9_9GAMM|nr:outer membrane lipoprotein-sorting protein [Grimontia marina]CZF83769.1 hypothetical protein GMA8713_02793 [Grimontia marina]